MLTVRSWATLTDVTVTQVISGRYVKKRHAGQ